MATVAVRRLAASSAKRVIHAAAEGSPASAAALQIHTGARTAALSSGAPYAPRVDLLNPDVLLRGLASTARRTPSLGPLAADLTTNGVDLRSAASTGRATTNLDPQAANMGNALIYLRGAASSGRGTPILDPQVQVEKERRGSSSHCRSQCQSSPCRSQCQTPIQAQSPARRVAPACHGSSSWYHSKFVTSSAVNKFGVRQFSSGAPNNGKEDGCKCNGDVVLKSLDVIKTKVGEIGDKVNEIDGKVDRNAKVSAKLEKDVEVLNVKAKGSGDWTSFKIKGKTINWLSVCSAVWEAIKAFHK